MSGLLKAELAQGQLRSLARGGGPAGASGRGIEPANPFAAFEQRIGELEAEVAGFQKSLPGLIDKAREEGRNAGLAEEAGASAKRLAKIESGLAQALGQWGDRLEAMNSLSVQIASTVLEMMIGKADWHGDFLAHAITARLAQLDTSMVIAVRLSPADISASELAQLNADSKVMVHVDDELEAGECTIELEMGEVKLGPAAQWQRAAALLEKLAGEPC